MEESKFTPIETQEQLNEIIGQRLARERAKFADYDELKSSVAAFSEKEAEYMAKLEEANKALEEAKAVSAEHEKTANEKAAEYEKLVIETTKIKTAAAVGLPPELASRLNGNTPEELMKDAEAMASLIHRGAPGKNPETHPAEDGVSAAFRRLNPNLKF